MAFDENGFRNAALKRGANPDTIEMYVQAIRARQSSPDYLSQQQAQSLDLLGKQQNLQQGDLQLKSAQLNYDKALRENMPVEVSKYMSQDNAMPDLSQLLIEKTGPATNNAPTDYSNLQGKSKEKTNQEKGILSRIANYLFPNASKFASNVGNSLVESAGQIGDVITGINPYASQESKIAAGKHFVEAQKKQEEYKKQVSLPDIARTSAEISSWMIPGGKGTKALVSGGVRGGVNALSKPNMTQKDLENAIVLGALTEGTLSNLGPIKDYVKGIAKKTPIIKKMPTTKALDNAANTIDQGTRQIKVKPSVYGASKEKAINETLDRWVGKGGAQQQYEKLQPAIARIENQISKVSRTNRNPITTTKDIKRSFMENLATKLRSKYLTNKQAISEINGYLKDLGNVGDDVTLEGIMKMKRLINSDYDEVAKAIAAGRSLTPRQIVQEAAWKSIDDAVKSASPEIKSLLRDQSNIYMSASSLSGARFNPPTLRAAGFSLPQVVTQKLRDATAGALRIPGKISQGTNNVINSVESALPAIVTNNGPRITTSGMLSLKNGTDNAYDDSQYIPNNDTNNDSGIGNYDESNNISGETDHMSNYNTSSAKSQYVTGKSPQEWYTAAQNAMQDNNPTAYKYFKELAEAELTQQNKAKSGKEPVTIDRFADDLRKIYFYDNKNGISLGENTVGVGGILPRIGLETKKITDQNYVNNLMRYNQARSIFAGLLNRARGAGTLNQGEYDTIIKNMPNETTPRPVAEAWFKDVKNILRGIDISKSQVSIQPE